MTAKTTTFERANASAGLFAHFSWRHVAYYLGFPLAIAFYAGLNNWQIQHIAGFSASIVFYLAHSLLPWWTTCAATTISMKALARWKPPWLVLLLLGHTLGCLLILPYSNWLTGIYETRWPELEITGDITPILSAEFWVYWLRAGVIWLAVNFIFDRYGGLPLYRYTVPRGFDTVARGSSDASESAAWGDRIPGFIKRLPAALGPNEVLAIKAEQHYIRVFSPDKEYMVLYRFSDAVRALDESLGQQVHRSYWVNTEAIDTVCTRAKDFHIRLVTGAEIPVSTPYQGMIRELVRTTPLTVRG